jgi:hypothetical protein
MAGIFDKFDNKFAIPEAINYANNEHLQPADPNQPPPKTISTPAKFSAADHYARQYGDDSAFRTRPKPPPILPPNPIPEEFDWKAFYALQAKMEREEMEREKAKRDEFERLADEEAIQTGKPRPWQERRDSKRRQMVDGTRKIVSRCLAGFNIESGGSYPGMSTRN